MADARGRRVEFADHDAEQGAAGPVLQAGEDERHRAGQHDAGKDLQRRCGKAAGHTDKARLARLHAGLRVDQDRDDGPEEDDRDLGPDADAEPDDDQRQQRHPRHGVERIHERAKHILQFLR